MSFDHSMAEEPKKPRRQSIISYFFALLVFALALTLTLAFGQPAPALQNPRSVPRARPRTPPVASDGVASRSLPTRAGETKEIVQPRSVNGTGKVHILVKVDSTDVVPESNENNNVGDSELTVALPDLVVPTVTLTPTTVTPGGGVVVGITLQNAGQGNTLNNFAYSIYLSTDSVLSAGDTLLSGPTFVGALTAGTSTGFSVGVSIPASTPTGTVFILVKIDSTDVIPEANEANNVGSATLNVSSATLNASLVTTTQLVNDLPDLVVPTVTLSPTTVTPGGGVVVGITLQNAGQGNTLNNFAYSIYLSTDSVLSAGDTLLSGPTFVGALTAGTSTGFSVGVSIPASTPTGAVFILVKIDSTDVIPEANEANNVTVAALMTALPDLVVPTVTLTPTTVTPGGGVVVGITLQNAGQGNTLNNFAYSIYLSTDSVLSAGDTLLSGPTFVGALTAGTSTGFSVGVSIPADIITPGHSSVLFLPGFEGSR